MKYIFLFLFTLFLFLQPLALWADEYSKSHGKKASDQEQLGISREYDTQDGKGYSKGIIYDHKKAQSDISEVVYCKNRPEGKDGKLFKPSFYVNFTEMPIKIKYSKSMSQLNQAADQTLSRDWLEEDEKREYIINQHKKHNDLKYTLSRTYHANGSLLSSEILTIRDGERHGCIWPTNIHLDIETHIAIQMASELESFECETGQLREHEDLHAVLIRKTTQLYEPKLRKALKNYLEAYRARRVHKSEFAEEAERIKQEMSKIVRSKIQAMHKDIEEERILIVSKSEDVYNSLACKKKGITD